MILVNNEQYTLRTWEPEDAASMAEHLNNKKIWDNVRDGLPYPYTCEDALAYIGKIKDNMPPTDFCICIDGRAVGNIGFTRGNDVERFGAEAGYWISEQYWGKGIMADALQQAVAYYFRHTDIIRIFATPYEFNRASASVLEKAGFTVKCNFIKAACKNGKFTGMLYYEKVKEEPEQHFLSGSGRWHSRSRFISAGGELFRGEGISEITILPEKIINHSYVELEGKRLQNDYIITPDGEKKYSFRSENSTLGAQTGTFRVNGSKLISDFQITGKGLHGFEIIRREGDICFADGALYDKEQLINTWSAILTKERN